ncbi:MAG: hypothetical protein OEW75_05920 [Cyclobacteriaceae bacterium]|nr:hypothetical protein [Cyclobacteriaceae bacterium]
MKTRQIAYPATECSVKDAEEVLLSFGRATLKGDFVGRFYDIFLESEPAVKPLFKDTDFVKQKDLLKQGISLIILHAKGSFVGTSGLIRIKDTHKKSKMGIPPYLYGYWKTSLIQTVTEFDKDITSNLLSQWHKVIDKGVKFIADGYDL